MEHGLDAFTRIFRKRSREQFDTDRDIGTKREPRPLFDTALDLCPRSISCSTTISIDARFSVDRTSIPALDQDPCGPSPGLGDDYIPLDDVAEDETDEDCGFFEGSLRTISQHSTSQAGPLLLSPAHNLTFGSAKMDCAVSLAAGRDEGAGEDGSCDDVQTDFTSGGQYKVKLVEELSFFGIAAFEKTYEVDIDYMSRDARHSRVCWRKRPSEFRRACTRDRFKRGVNGMQQPVLAG
ncbi:hypothetical protein FKW77_000567 [Venturia effusa]|uniref:Uncharacterized protein n=1 Tax=Venturia effusa TaxID=50376 RepID=A0A517L0P8_9PEZI|nr:hypothetical protein FKW77_000567 [Venturia effusa]